MRHSPMCWQWLAAMAQPCSTRCKKNIITEQMVRSVYDALQRGADNQVSGVLGTLQGAVAQINTPEMMWVFSRPGCPLDVNNPDHPAILTVATNPTTSQTLSPLCSLVITVATKLMNQPGKVPSFVMLDEAPTVFIPEFGGSAEYRAQQQDSHRIDVSGSCAACGRIRG